MRRPSLNSLRFRLWLLILLTVVPVLALTLYTNAELRRLAADEAKNDALQLARAAASDQREAIRDTRQLLFVLAQLPEVHSADPSTCSEFFSRLLSQWPQYAILGVVARNGDLICSAPSTSGPTNLAHRSYFGRASQTRDFAVGDYESNAFTDRTTLDFGYPVLDEAGQVQAVVFASLDLAWLSQTAVDAQLPEGSTFTVIDRKGTILVRYPDPEDWVGLSEAEAPIVEIILARQGEGTTEAHGIDGVHRLFAFTPLSSGPGGEDVYVSVGVPTSEAYAGAERVLVRNLTGLGLVSLSAFAVAWFSSDVFILHRVRKLVSATKRLSAGDLGVRTGISDDGGELSQLACAFDEMAESLERRVAERDRAEDALQESQRVLSTLMSNLPGMAYRCDHDQSRTMIFVSEGCLDLTGYRPSDLIQNRGVSYGQLICADDRGLVWQEMQAAFQENRPFRVIYRITTAAGEDKWVWEQGRVVALSEGGPLTVEGFIADVTERVMAQQVLEQRVASRTRELSALYDVTAVASASLDLDTVLTKSLDQVLAAMESKVGAIHLTDEAGTVLRLAAWRGIPSDILPEIEAVPANGGLASWVVGRAEPVVVPDIATGLQPLLTLPANSSQAYVGAPIRARGQVLGVLSVIGETGREFSEAEVSLLSSIADQVGVAVENARLYQQAEQLAVLKERERLARDLHDSVTQSLYSLVLLSEAGRQLAENGDLQCAEGYLKRFGEIGQQALKEMRLLVYELRPLVLKREGLVGALQHRLDAVEKRAGIDARLLVEGQGDLPAPVEETLYRIAQEALNNALKHAAPTAVTVQIRYENGAVELEVVDDGAGFDADAGNSDGGLGLISMKERAERIGGTLVVLSTPGEGTRVKVRINRG